MKNIDTRTKEALLYAIEEVISHAKAVLWCLFVCVCAFIISFGGGRLLYFFLSVTDWETKNTGFISIIFGILIFVFCIIGVFSFVDKMACKDD